MSANGTLNGTITDTGGENADFRGFVWDTVTRADPGDTAPGVSAYSDNWTEGGSFGTGAFSHQITGLNEGDTYYVRACAHNSGGWSYGGEVNFPTPTRYTKTVSMSALLEATDTKTVAIDALLRALGITKTVAIDALLEKRDTKSIDLDAFIVAVGLTKTVALDIILAKFLKEISLDTLLEAVDTKTINLDALLRISDTKAVNLDALIALVKQTGTVNLDTLLEIIDTKTINLTTLLEIVDAKTIDLDTLLQVTGITKSVAMDAILKAVDTETVDLDALLLALGITKTVALDILLRISDAATVDLDAYIAATDSAVISLDIILKAFPSGALSYIIEVRNSSDELLAILHNAFQIGLVEEINRPPMLDFKLPSDDSKLAYIIKANELWLRNYETGVLLHKFLLSRRKDVRV